MAQWYYASGQQQLGPVSWDQLRQLASAGKLTRDSMVWTEGMADWKKASAVEGLMPGGGATAVTAKPTRRVDAVDVVDDDRDDDLPRRRKKRKKEGMSPGALAGIIGGSVGGVIVVIIIIVVIVSRVGRMPPVVQGPAQPVAAPGALPPGIVVQGGNPGVANAAGGPAVQPQSYTVTLNEDANNQRAFNFQQGQSVTITVTTRGGLLQVPDVDLFVRRSGDNNFEIFDDSLSKDCFVTFVAPATDQYFLQLDNLGPGRATCTVNIR